VTEPEEPAVAVFAPVTVLTVTLERPPDGDDEVHVHPGGQGVWQSRMARLLGARPVLCTPLGGETGVVIRALLEREEIEHPALEMSAANPTWIHDRRDGERDPVWEGPPFQLGRHEIDELFSATLAKGLGAGVCIVAGTHEGLGALEADTYRRVVGDLGAGGAHVVVDVTGEELEAALQGGPHVVKVSEDDMRRDGRLGASGSGHIGRLARQLVDEGAERVVVSRAEAGAVAFDGTDLLDVEAPQLDVADARGAGDSMTAGLAVGLARGLDWTSTLRLAAAAGAVNATRHGSGSGRVDAVAELAKRVTVEESA
jgi:1-phosphofructokinase